MVTEDLLYHSKAQLLVLSETLFGGEGPYTSFTLEPHPPTVEESVVPSEPFECLKLFLAQFALEKDNIASGFCLVDAVFKSDLVQLSFLL